MKNIYLAIGGSFFEINKVWLFTELLLGTNNYDLIDKIVNELQPAYNKKSEILTLTTSINKEGKFIEYMDKYSKRKLI